MNNNYIEQKKNSHLYFQIGDYKYAINTTNVLEIIKLPALDYPQKLPNKVVGLLKYNNFVINVVDIRFYLNLEVKPYTLHNELIIVKTDEVIFGIITDKIIGIKAFDTSMIDSLPYADNTMIIESLYKNEMETISIINIYAIEQILKNHETSTETFNEADIANLMPNDKNSKLILTKRAESLTKKFALNFLSTNLYAKDKYISFNLNNDYYCIAINYVKEVLKDTSVTKVPGTPDFIEGIMNLRGDYITVLNLKKFLNLQSEISSEEKKNPVIIIKDNDMKIALLIDKINELFDFQEIEPETNNDGYFLNKFIRDNSLYTLLNIEKILNDKKIVVTDV